MSSKLTIGITCPEILLPAKDVPLTTWAVVACDQYTSQPEYWHEVEDLVDDVPSTLRLIFPEVYLEDPDSAQRIEAIRQAMNRYVEEGILQPMAPGFVYLDRQTSHAPSRKGLMVAVDLEQYDYRPGAQSLVRATEGTVLDRLPPRIKVRENAPLELPHIMVLIDDPEQMVIEPLSAQTDALEKLYDVDLMMNGGHVTGFRVNDEHLIQQIQTAIERLASPQAFKDKYGVGDEHGVLLFAVGDGNHSLATAKACWEQLKPTIPAEAREDHPARYALVELVNVHDKGLVFEPIHRVVFNIDSQELFEAWTSLSPNASKSRFENKEAACQEAERRRKANVHAIPFVDAQGYGVLTMKNPQLNLEVGTLQAFLDDFLKAHPEAKVDYIHGDDVVNTLGSQEGNMGFLLPAMEKTDLFRTVILDGVLPRKTFSMGEAEEKRFYLECRRIR